MRPVQRPGRDGAARKQDFLSRSLFWLALLEAEYTENTEALLHASRASVGRSIPKPFPRVWKPIFLRCRESLSGLDLGLDNTGLR